ncbi:MAG: hypothetical protein MMC33_002729 [Icmadophila ericetorum]|nr:hypothetical protein [Icmadophila ericetorum]
MARQIFVSTGHVVQLIEHWQLRHVRSTGYFKLFARELRKELSSETKEVDSQICTRPQDPSRSTHSPKYVDQASSPITDNDEPRGRTSGARLEDSTENSDLQNRHQARPHSPHKSLQSLTRQTTVLGLNHHAKQHSDHSNRRSSAIKTPDSSMPDFASLLAAEEYLEATLSTWPLSSSYDRPLFSFSIAHGCPKMQLTLPDLRIYYPRFPKPLPSLIHTPLRFSLLIPLTNHLYAQGRHPCTGYPSFFTHALSSPQNRSLSTEALTLYLLFHPFIPIPTSQPPTPTATHNVSGVSPSSVATSLQPPRKNHPTTAAFYQPFQIFSTLLLQICLLLALELSIYWNHISGISSMNAVGQLVPLILGVGGLVKVLWSFAKEWYYKRGAEHGEEEEEDETKDLRICAELFAEMKN